jgi:hypothetical protein
MDEQYALIAQDMIAADSERDDLFLGIDDMWHGYWKLPGDLDVKDDIREIIDLSPHDALKSGTSIMSTSLPHWIVQPLRQNPGEQDRAERIAYGIDFNYRRMCLRGSSTTLWDMVHSALRYDAVAVWLEFLPHKFGKNPTLRQRHALRGGNFAAPVHNPRTIHVQRDMYGTNRVLLSSNMTAQEVVNQWGIRAIELEKKLRENKDTGVGRFVYNDLILYEGDHLKRVVWGKLSDSEFETYEAGQGDIVLMDENLTTPFMPWVVQFGGSNLETDSRYSVHPLLGPLVHSHKWQDLNIFQSILQSEIIKYGRSPRVKTVTPGGDGVQIDYEDGSTLNLRTGESADAWKPAPIDQDLKELVDRVRSEVSSATLPRILQNPEFAGNTPFASINAMIQTALGGLNTSKVLCENAHAELGLRMVEWCKFANKPLVAYQRGKSAKEGKDLGSYISVMPEEMNPETLMITCHLFAEAPTDFTQRLNNGIMMNRELKVPRSEVLADLGKENVDSLYDQWVQEQFDDSEVMTTIQLGQQKAAMELKMAIQGAASTGGMPQTAQAMPQGYPSNTQGTGGTGMPEGQGYNPNVGGLSPATGNPGVSLREQISGVDRTGRGI